MEMEHRSGANEIVRPQQQEKKMKKTNSSHKCGDSGKLACDVKVAHFGSFNYG